MNLKIKHLEIYDKFGGDEDGLARAGSVEEKKCLGGKPWSTISELVQSWRLVKRGKTADSFNEEFERSLAPHLDPTAIEEFKRRF